MQMHITAWAEAAARLRAICSQAFDRIAEGDDKIPGHKTTLGRDSATIEVSGLVIRISSILRVTDENQLVELAYAVLLTDGDQSRYVYVCSIVMNDKGEIHHDETAEASSGTVRDAGWHLATLWVVIPEAQRYQAAWTRRKEWHPAKTEPQA